MKDIKSLIDAFNAYQTEMKTNLDKQNAEIQKNGESSAATATAVAELNDKLVQVAGEIEEAKNELRQMETAMSRPGNGRDDRQSIGARFAASDEIAALRNGSGTQSDAFQVGNFFSPRAAIDGASAGDIVVPQRRSDIIVPAQARTRLRDLLNVNPTESSSIEYIEETGFTNAGAPVAEGGLKPESTLSYAKRSVPVEVIAHWVQITRQILSDAPRLEATVEGRLTYGLEVKEEAQFLYGTGLSPNLQGIMTHADVQTYLWSAGVEGDTKIDAVRRAMLKARVAEYPVTGIVMHPNDWADIELMKGNDGHYIWVQVPVGGEMRLWRAPVVETTAINPGDFLTGAFGLGATAWDREETNIRVTDAHADYFIRNKLVMLVEERVGLTIERPEAFVNGSFDAAPAAAV